jgi:enamine deaminase RidA (YjgF/YER057c/UK114 family)
MPEQISWEDINMSSNKLLSPAYKSQGRVFTSGVTGVDSQGVMPDDVVEQTELCCANMKKVLEASDSSMDKVLKVLLFIKRREDGPAVNRIYEKHFGTRPGRSCIIVDFPNQKMLVEFEVVATADSLTKVSWDDIQSSGSTFLSPAFKSNGILHTSGQTGDRDGSMPDDIEQQTENAILNVKNVLESSGSSLGRSLKVLLFISDSSYGPIVNKIYEKYFTNRPGRSCVIVNFPNPKILVELEVIAEYGEQTAKMTTWEDIKSSGNSLLSPAYTSNGIVFTSGQLGTASNGLSDDVAEQTENSIKNVITVLEASGSNIDKVLKVLLFIKRGEDAAIINKVYEQYFTTKPARSCIIVDFPNPKVAVEIEVIAETGNVTTKL